MFPAKVETPDTLTSSTYILLHSFAADPRSHVSLSSGMILESTSPPKTILSVSASPRVKVPPSNLVVPLTVKSPPTCKSLMKVPTPVKVESPVTERLRVTVRSLKEKSSPGVGAPVLPIYL